MIKYKWTKSINLNLKYVWRVYDNTEIMSAWRLVLVSERTEGGLHGRELSGPLSCFWNVKLVSLVMCSSNWKLQFTIFLVLIIQFPPEAESSNLIIIAKVSCLHNSHKLEGSERKVKSQSAARKDVLPSKRKGRDQTTIKKTLERQTQFFYLGVIFNFIFYIVVDISLQRSPSCMIRCLRYGALHPAQCHMMCWVLSVEWDFLIFQTIKKNITGDPAVNTLRRTQSCFKWSPLFHQPSWWKFQNFL